jgi:hypothetical protein
MLLQDLPPKAAHQILRSVTWTKVELHHRVITAVRGSISRAARWASGFRIHGVIFTHIFQALRKARASRLSVQRERKLQPGGTFLKSFGCKR